MRKVSLKEREDFFRCLFLAELSGLASAEEGLTEVKWKIDNRYYSAEVTVTSHDITGLDNTELAPLEAVIFLCLINDVSKNWQRHAHYFQSIHGAELLKQK